MQNLDIADIQRDVYSRQQYMDTIKNFAVPLPAGTLKPRMKKADLQSFFLQFYQSNPTHPAFQQIPTQNQPNNQTSTNAPNTANILNPIFGAPSQIINNSSHVQLWQDSFAALQPTKQNFQFTEHLLDSSLDKVPIGHGIVLKFNGDLYIFRTMSNNGVNTLVHLVSTRFNNIIIDDYTLPNSTLVLHLTPTAAQIFHNLSNTLSGAFHFDIQSVTTAPANTMSGATSSAAQPSLPTGLADALQEASGGASKQTLRGRNLTIPAASSLSSSGPIIRDTGIPVIFNRLKYPEQSNLARWGLPSFITQLQPAHLFDLVFSWRSVDLNYFAGLEDRFGKIKAENLSTKFELMGKTEVDKSIPIASNLIGNDINRYHRALMGYGFVLDTMFIFKPLIQQALIATLLSAINFVRPWMRGNQDDVTGKMFEAVTTVYMDGLQRAYGHVFATQSIIAEHDVVSLFSQIPSPDRYQELIVEMQRLSLISRDKDRPSHGLEDDTTPRKKAKHDPKKNPTSKSAPTPTPTKLPNKRNLCAFFNSTDGCKKIDDCERIHAKPANSAEEEALAHFFLKRPKLTRN